MTDDKSKGRELIPAPIPSYTLDQVQGRDWYVNILRACIPAEELDEFMKLELHQVLALCGLPGSGKRTLASAYVGTAAMSGITCYRISGRDFPDDSGEAGEQLREVVSEIAARNGIAVVEGCGCRALWEALDQVYAPLKRGDLPICLLIEDDEELLTSPWVRNMFPLHLLPPDLEAREAFFAMDENRMMRRGDLQHKLPTHRWLAEHSEGLNYNDLNQVVMLLRLQLKERAIRKYGGSKARLFEEGVKTGQFFYTEEMFDEAVEMVRKNHPVQAQPVPAAMDLPPLEAPASEGSRRAELLRSAQQESEEQKTEDEKAMQAILSRLRPPT